MQFYEYRTNFERFRKHSKEQVGIKLPNVPLKWYDFLLIGDNMDKMFNVKMLRRQVQEGNINSSLAGERAWYENGCPYYKVYPRMAEMMAEISIDIPCESVEVPYRAFTIHFANDAENQIAEQNGPRLSAILVHEVYVNSTDGKTFKYLFEKGKGAQWPKFQDGSVRALYINYYFDGFYRGEPYAFNYMLPFEGPHNRTKTIEEFFENSWDDSNRRVMAISKDDEYVPSKQMIKTIVKIAIATCFFGIDQHEFVLPDLPRKKIEKRFKLGTQIGLSQSEIIQHLKTDRENSKKWTIGREISLPRPIVEEVEVNAEGKRSISHGYIRRGHMRWQPVGEGRQGRKLIFVHPHICREDLPLGKQHGFKITG